MFRLIKSSINIIKSKGIKRFLFEVKKYLAKNFLYTPIFGLIAYERQRRKNPLIIQDVQGSKMMLNLENRGICRDLFLNKGLREPECTRILKQELRKGMVVVDIGANIGYYVLQEAKIVGENGKVYALEPEPANFELLKKNITLNNYSPDLVGAYQLAVGDRTGKFSFYISENCNWHTMSELKGEQKSKLKIIDKIEVDTITLDGFTENKRPPDFVRMDVEGFEFRILKGMKRMLLANRRIKICMEVHPLLIEQGGEKAESMLKLLSDYGFNINYLVEEDLNFSFSAIKRRIKEGPIVLSEKSTEYRKPIKELLINKKIKNKLIGDESYCLFFGEIMFNTKC